MISTFWGKAWVEILSQFSATFFLIAQIAGGLFGGGERGGKGGLAPGFADRLRTQQTKTPGSQTTFYC